MSNDTNIYEICQQYRTDHELDTCLSILCYAMGLQDTLDCKRQCQAKAPCEEERTLFIRVLYIYYPLVLLLCWGGNMLNMLVYWQNYWKSSTTIRLLFAKAIANISFTTAFLNNVLHPIILQQTNSETWYWDSYLAFLFVQNLFGTWCIWLTLFMTVETFLLIVFPVTARDWCTLSNTRTATIVSALVAAALQAANPITREVARCHGSQSRYSVFVRDGRFFEVYERVYFWLSAVSVYILPFTVMLTLACVIAYQFYWKRAELAHMFSLRKRSIIRITFATIWSYVLFETLSLALFIRNAVEGSAYSHRPGGISLCALSEVGNMLTLFNASVPFFIYVACSNKFRQLLAKLCCGTTENTSLGTTTAAYSTVPIAPNETSSHRSPRNP